MYGKVKDMNNHYDVYGIGNAVIDIEFQVTNEFLERLGLRKGVTTLVAPEVQQELLMHLTEYEPHIEAGGSVANTLAGIALLGGTALFKGKVGKDSNGDLYEARMITAGVDVDLNQVNGSTGTALVLVTQDGQRTIQVSLDDSVMLQPGDLSRDQISRSKYLYVEGYMSANPASARLAEEAMAVAQDLGIPVALTYSDPTIVEAFHHWFKKTTRNLVNMIFCNESEGMVYSQTSSPAAALKEMAKYCQLIFMTCGKDGSLIYDNGELIEIGSHPIQVVDTTGAGDMYAAGILYGLTHDLGVRKAGLIASYASAQVVSKFGPRLTGPIPTSLDALLKSQS